MLSNNLVWVAALLVLSASPASAGTWSRYVDSTTGLRLDIPTAVFSQDVGEPDGGAGRRFVTKDGRANLSVQTMRNERGDTPAAFLASKNPPPNIVYRRITKTFFVVSSYRNNIIFYNRCNFVERAAHCVLINYPASEKKVWDEIVSRMSLSLR